MLSLDTAFKALVDRPQGPQRLLTDWRLYSGVTCPYDMYVPCTIGGIYWIIVFIKSDSYRTVDISSTLHTKWQVQNVS